MRHRRHAGFFCKKKKKRVQGSALDTALEKEGEPVGGYIALALLALLALAGCGSKPTSQPEPAPESSSQTAPESKAVPPSTPEPEPEPEPVLPPEPTLPPVETAPSGGETTVQPAEAPAA